MGYAVLVAAAAAILVFMAGSHLVAIAATSVATAVRGAPWAW